MSKKKTTLMLDENLYSEIRKRATQRGLSTSAVVAEALSAYVATKSSQPKPRISLTVASGGGWTGPLDATSNRDLLDPLDRD